VSAPPFSAVVVIHDSRPDLAALLASMKGHLPEQPQLIVVDTGSRDGGADLAREHGAEVVDLPGNPGFGAANNAGVERATGEVTVLLNPDVELLDYGLALLAQSARLHEALHAPRLLNANRSTQRSAHPVPGLPSALVPAMLPGRLLPASFEPHRSRTKRAVGWAIGACLAAPTALLRRLGPFDPDPFLFYEDLDLCLRARAAGVPTMFHPEVTLRHAGAHATEPAFGGEPFALLARRRREVVGARLGARALALDDAAQGLTFATRAAAKALMRRGGERERAQLAALRSARRG
jgi:N-acetylglucosaminyl-diphospho-decaprenol L-rhamnosyltransferase